MNLHPILRLEMTSLPGDAFESDSTKTELLTKRLAEVKVIIKVLNIIQCFPTLERRRFDFKENQCLKGAKVRKEGETERGQ